MSPPKPNVSPTKIISEQSPQEMEALGIDSLNQDVNIDFEENFPHKKALF